MENDELEATQQATQLQTQTQTQTQYNSPPYLSWGMLRPISEGLETIVFSGLCYCFGRSTRGNQIVFAGKKISNFHAKIFRGEGSTELDNGGVVMLEDLSSNGTYVNFKKVGKGQRMFLNQGDEISFGGYGINHSIDAKNDFRYIFCIPTQSQADLDERAVNSPIYDEYIIKEKLGKGTFATVRLCIDKTTGAQRAVKIIDKARFANNEKTLQMFQREVNILKELNHENVAKFVNYFDDPKTIFIVMELVTGGDLLDYIMKEDGLSEIVSQTISGQICHAMRYTHSKGITHRDLKPENILLNVSKSDSGTKIVAKVTDFGLAKMVDDQTFLKTMCGTPAYLAPEVVLHNSEVGYDQAVDSWSMGVIVYSMLANASPFEDDEQQPLAQRIINRHFHFTPLRDIGVSPSCLDFVQKLLTTNPKSRMTLTTACQHPWIKGTMHYPSSFTTTSTTQSTNSNTPCSESHIFSSNNSDGTRRLHTEDFQISPMAYNMDNREINMGPNADELAEFNRDFDYAPETPKLDASVSDADDPMCIRKRALMNSGSFSDLKCGLQISHNHSPPSIPLPSPPKDSSNNQSGWSDSTPEDTVSKKASQNSDSPASDTKLHPQSSLHIPLQPLSIKCNQSKINHDLSGNILKRKASDSQNPNETSLKPGAVPTANDQNSSNHYKNAASEDLVFAKKVKASQLQSEQVPFP